MDIIHLYNCWQDCNRVITDSRIVSEGDMFFALKGANFDGNRFAKQALAAGATYVVVDDPSLKYEDDKIILVNDVLESLQNLAKYRRSLLKIPVVALTGSNGKTTTKELCRDVLAQKMSVYATEGNFNNHIGVPLTILRAPDDIGLLFIEMGANHQGEIEFLCNIAKPAYGMITNIGKAHLDGFGGIEGVKRGKSEIYRYLVENNGTIFINEEDEELIALVPGEAKTIGYKPSKMIKIISEQPFIRYECNHREYATQLYGTYNVTNMAFAVTVGRFFGVEEEKIHQAISDYVPANNRSQVFQKDDNVLILDAYNANPTSMAASLESLSKMEGQKIVILGDMLELGQYSQEEHERILNLVQSLNFEDAIFIGEEFLKISYGRNGHFFKTTSEAGEYIKNHPFNNKSILLKGSRGVAVEKLLNVF